MIVKITCCVCKATFEIKEAPHHPKDIICPNCGQVLPANASEDLLKALDAFEKFESKLEHDHYCISYSMNISKAYL